MENRYLEFDCGFKACKYDNVTWGQLLKLDYLHFVDLMSHHVPVDSKTFEALAGEMTPTESAAARAATRYVDTAKFVEDAQHEYMLLECTHKGRMNGRTWGYIFKNDYKYFMWAVGNTMGRQTRTFKVFSSMLMPEHVIYVQSTPKGQVKASHQNARASAPARKN